MDIAYSIGEGPESVLRPGEARPNDNSFTNRQSMQVPTPTPKPSPDAQPMIPRLLVFAQASILSRRHEYWHVVILADPFGRRLLLNTYDRENGGTTRATIGYVHDTSSKRAEG